ncbi:SUKH-3 domain-containing protein [Herpetosiphon giganteus]|uniref:SUKH-3 domain-containing protein n=1 Tax=Herpetosiphon giganteus TaxID=2029754 RepID=UPI00195BD5B9|nr:SUKH-3 domain-containing protein [Herpetosiphon giganteus]MBM7846635.1 hypothetical protein [Herpetosiphon giganteus]
MTLNINLLTDQTIFLLTAAGWSPERTYDPTTTILEPLTTIGWPIFPEAQRIFTALGMLNLNLQHLPPIPPDPRTTTPDPIALRDHLWYADIRIDFDPYEAFAMDDEDFIVYWSSHPLVHHHGGSICPIGSYHPWDTLLVCGDGLIVHGSPEFMNPAPGLVVLGSNIETALNQLAYEAVFFV